MLHMPHRGPVLNAFNPAVGTKPSIFHIQQRMSERFVQRGIRSMNAPLCQKIIIIAYDAFFLFHRIAAGQLGGTFFFF